MTEDKKENTQSNDSSIYYILGGVVLVAAVAGFFLLKPKAITPQAETAQTVPTTPAAPANITKFACEKQYYNPVLGFPKYFLSAEGVHTTLTGNVTCEFTAAIKDKTVATISATATLVEARERGGATFRCQTDAVELARNVATDIKVVMTDDAGAVTSCKQSFIF